MRLTEIKIKKLFDTFDHSIDLRMDERITIIHGPNGYGKTMILQMVQGALTKRFSIFRRIPFEEFTMAFDNGQKFSISKRIEAQKKKNQEPAQQSLQISLSQQSGVTNTFNLPTRDPNESLRFPINMIEDRIPNLEYLGNQMWMDASTGNRLDITDIFESYGEYLPFRVSQENGKPEWLAKFADDFQVRLIEAQRLINLAARNRNKPERMRSLELSVSSYSRELAAQIQERQAYYGTFSQKLDSTFPSRALQQKERSADSVENLVKKLEDLEQRRQRIVKAGLLTSDPQSRSIFAQTSQVDDSTKSILSLYAEDVENKLSVLNETTQKIELLKELVNKRFSYKHVDIDEKYGFRLSTSSGSPLVPADLSSGEQHELVILYELLFRTGQNALILIDEPELSLHVGWQIEFLEDLKRIISLTSFDVLMATHSPQIINDRWDLTVELKGPDL
jgi:predicted ATP-binding protein involved in virulence